MGRNCMQLQPIFRIFGRMTAWLPGPGHIRLGFALDGEKIAAVFPEAQYDQNRVCVIWKNLGFAEGFSPD